MLEQEAAAAAVDLESLECRSAEVAAEKYTFREKYTFEKYTLVQLWISNAAHQSWQRLN